MNKSLAWNATVGLLLLLFSACGTPSRTRYEVLAPSGDQPRVSAQDREQVKEALGAVASELRLKDFTATSLVPETIAFYQQESRSNPLKLLAWVDNDRIFVEVQQFPPQPGDSLLYQRARTAVQEELSRRFGQRSSSISFRDIERGTPPDPR